VAYFVSIASLPGPASIAKRPWLFAWCGAGCHVGEQLSFDALGQPKARLTDVCRLKVATAKLKFNGQVGSVGPLPGKVGVTVLLYALSWLVLHTAWRTKSVSVTAMALFSFVLLGVELLGTFPPFFELNAGH
jgi:hypothetical protein